MNEHIEKYLKEYLKLEKPEFAVLLTGKWGSGKTYFIENFIENNTNEAKIKFIKISLFGLKKIDSIDEQIFQNLHPFLGNKYVKLTGNLLKASVKFGTSIDLNNDSEDDSKITVNTNKFNPLDFFSDKKSTVKIIFVFDDLERTDIELTEMLGYVNYLVEQSDFNVIVLANEEKITEKNTKEEPSKYDEFKEKVIGKTFEVQHDFDTIISSFIDEKTDKSKKYLSENKNTIKKIYRKANHNNLRHIKQILLDFEYFIKEIDEEYLEHEEFMSILINNFFALSVELKSGSLTEKELYSKPILIFNADEEKSNLVKIYEKYNIENNSIFSGIGWVMVLLKSSLPRNAINKIIGELSFFIKETNNEQLSWVRLKDYRTLENDNFEKILKDVLDKFKKCSYESPEHFLHVVALLISLYKSKLSAFNVQKIKEQVEKCMQKCKTTFVWNNEYDDFRSFEYTDNADNDFRQLLSSVEVKIKSINKKNLAIQEESASKKLLKAIQEWDKNCIEKILNEYETKPIFQNLSPNDFIKQINEISHKNLRELGYILHYRYDENKIFNNIKFYCYLIKELPFWKEIKKELESSKTATGLKKFLLKEFENHLIDKIIVKLESCNKNS